MSAHHDGAPPIRMVALDLDGTILEAGATITSEVLTALATLQANGVICVTATGRPLDFQLDLLERHGVGPATGRFRALIADEREIHLLGEQQQGTAAYHPHEEWNAVIRKRWDSLLDEALQWLEVLAEEAARRDWATRMYDRTVIARRGLASLWFEQPRHAAELRAWLTERLAAAGSELVSNRNIRLVQVIDRLAGKGNVLSTLADLCGISADQVLAIGDSSNDTAMLDGTFGFRAATPGNADPEVKAAVRHAGGYVARATVGAGVIEALTVLCSAALER
jgi:HAD superfamily hydrolase (TIGR01484 family)